MQENCSFSKKLLDKLEKLYPNLIIRAIDEENEFDKDVTIVKTNYKASGEEGTIAIIGPQRMEYDKVVTLLNFIKSQIER